MSLSHPSVTFLRWLPVIVFLVVFSLLITDLISLWRLDGDFNRQWSILTSAIPAGGHNWGWLTYILSGLGYALMPVSLGLTVTYVISRYTRKHLLGSGIVKAETIEELEAALEKLRTNGGSGTV